MKVLIQCDDEVDYISDQFELWCLLNDSLRNFPISVSLEICSVNHRILDLALETGVKEK